jgi:hypothetical protein
MSEKIIGYKALKSDMSSKWGDMTYELDKVYRLDNDQPIELCQNGFHFCDSLENVQDFYDLSPVSSNRLFEVEVLGTVVNSLKGKACTYT